MSLPTSAATVAQCGPGLGLGIDAGGSRTRWALAGQDGRILGSGVVAGMSALQMAHPGARLALHADLSSLCRAALQLGLPVRVQAGLTGFDVDSDHGRQVGAWLAELLAIDVGCVTLCSDIDIAYLDSFGSDLPGQGYLVYAGTGSIGAWVDASGQLQRAGGRGVLLDDGGGGYWIARAALRLIWRREDVCPGSWRTSKLAQAVFDHVGGSDWACTRRFMYEKQRGDIGQLARVVAATVDADPAAAAILCEAGRELARLAQALTARYGPRPIALAGRAAGLHPSIFDAMHAALPAQAKLTQRTVEPHLAAARIAAGVIRS